MSASSRESKQFPTDLEERFPGHIRNRSWSVTRILAAFRSLWALCSKGLIRHNETSCLEPWPLFSILAGKFPVLFIWNLRPHNQETHLAGIKYYPLSRSSASLKEYCIKKKHQKWQRHAGIGGPYHLCGHRTICSEQVGNTYKQAPVKSIHMS